MQASRPALLSHTPAHAVNAGPCRVQGLSDWTGEELPKVGSVLHSPCTLYHLVPESRVDVGECRGWDRRGACGGRMHTAHGHKGVNALVQFCQLSCLPQQPTHPAVHCPSDHPSPNPLPWAGVMLREWWRYAPGDGERALTYANPCQSTGMWYLEPTPMVGGAGGLGGAGGAVLLRAGVFASL